MATVEATSQKVQRILAAEFTSVRLVKSGFALEHGSTAVFIEPLEWAPDKEGNPRSLVRVWSPLGREVRASPELYHWAATEGQQLLFGSVSVIDVEGGGANVIYDETLLGDYLDPAELLTTVYAVIFTADDLDEVVATRFGGKRYTDA